MTNYEKAFENYFSTSDNKAVEKPDKTEEIANINDESYTYKPQKNIRTQVEKQEFQITSELLKADDNIDNIEQLCVILKKLLNAAFGPEWGEISPDLKRGENSNKIITPQITAEINSRDVADKMPLKPVLMNTVKETVNNEYTGDSILYYRQWFDCNVEFNFYGETAKEARDIQNKFETLVSIYAGYLKRHGISEILFLHEMSPRNSLNFTEQIPMKCLIYYVRFERITPVRQSLINKINTNIGIKELSEEQIQTVVEHNNTKASTISDMLNFDDLDFDFNNSGVDYSDI